MSTWNDFVYLVYQIEIRDPCYDQNYVALEDGEIGFTNYEIGEPLKLWKHTGFQVRLIKNSDGVDAEALCGKLDYIAFLDEQVLSLDSEPVSYDAEALEFGIFTED